MDSGFQKYLQNIYADQEYIVKIIFQHDKSKTIWSVLNKIKELADPVQKPFMHKLYYICVTNVR